VKREQFEALLDRLAARLRMRAAASRLLLPVAVLLTADVVAVLVLKLLGIEDAAIISAELTAGLLVACAVGGGLLYALGPVSRLRAAAELDRLTGLKERAASLVVVRSSAAAPSRLVAALQADAERALAGVDPSEVCSRSAPLPARYRWLGVLLAATLAALLVPVRGHGKVRALADMIAGGPALVDILKDVAESGDQGAPQVETARKALRLVKAPPPSDPQEIEDRRVKLEDLARELRRQGATEAAARLQAALRLLAGAGDSAPDGAGDPGAGGAARKGVHDSYPERYRELLARYFSAGG
jgi:hypothetical protein